MSRTRVVVTGLSAVTPIGDDLETSWSNLLAGVSGIKPITRFDTTDHATKIAGEIRDFDTSPYIEPKQARRMDYFSKYSVACAKMLLENARFEITDENAARVGTLVGCGLGGIHTIEANCEKLLHQGPRRISPFFIPVLIANMAAGHISIYTGAKGPNMATVSACASGVHSVGYAFSEILLDRADAMICGGTESTISPLGVSGFNAMKALSTRNDEPERASRPFDKERDGFIMGEGCGLLLLEPLDKAKARGATIYGEVVGFGASADAYHIAAPPESGEGMALAMEAAIRDAGVAKEAVDHINAHGTSTQLNDLCETRAVKTVFGKRAYDIPISANKSMVGHLLGAAGGVESVFTVLSLREGKIPGTINLEHPDPECDLDYCADGTRDADISHALCNSFGFGGTNCSILFKKYED